MKTKTEARAHTPGPWHRNISPAWKYPVYADKNGDANGKDWVHIAAVLSGNPNAEADLNLITAAPELLDACKIVLKIADAEGWDRVGVLLSKAIAKAEGK